MIYTSIIEGMKSFMGNFVTATAMFVIYVVFGRPPDQEGREESSYAISSSTVPTYGVLVAAQVVFATASVLDLFYYGKSPLFTIAAILLQATVFAQICSIFIFNPETSHDLKNLD